MSMSEKLQNETKEQSVTFDVKDINTIIAILGELSIRGADCFKLANILNILQTKGIIK